MALEEVRERERHKQEILMLATTVELTLEISDYLLLICLIRLPCHDSSIPARVHRT